MLALESLGRRVSEDRPQVKFSKTPSYGDDVKWLMKVARQLGKLKKNLILSLFLQLNGFSFIIIRIAIFANIPASRDEHSNFTVFITSK